MNLGVLRAAAVAAIVGAITVTTAAATAKAPPKTGFIKVHAAEAEAYQAKPTVHDPVCQGSCEACHDQPEAPKHVRMDQPALCLTCHADREADLKKAHRHPPFESGDCTSCHDPHASDHPRLLADEVNAVCATCHQPDADILRTAHGGIVVAGAKCTECHTPHGSANEHLITEAPKHPPFEAGTCDACHAKPGPDGKVKLEGEPGKACFACHGDKEGLGELASVHPPFAAGDCATCHSPHASRVRSFLRAEPADLCRTCHDDIPDMGHPVGFHPSHRAWRRNPADPSKPFDCVSCHNPHAAAYPQLRSAAPATFCLTCHQEQGGLTR